MLPESSRGPFNPLFLFVFRSCTDVLCCMIFMLFIMAYILLGLAAWVNGDPRRVAYPTDSQGYFCGQKGTPNENKSILFYFNMLTCTSPSVVVNLQCPTTQICVSKCPERFLTFMEIQFKYKNDSEYWTYYSQFCRTTFLKPVECALAGAFASYYWALKKPDDIPPYPLFTAFGRAIRYHTGSLAFGSLILAIIQMFRLILEYLDKRLQILLSYQNNINCLPQMAIYGKNFCKSARDAFNLLMRNILKIAVMDRVTDFVLILGKILVAGCIVEDLERNDGSAEKPYYMSQSLMKIMNRRNVETKKQ
ncbi:hypothetical protein MJG53_001890 [Ovis ammon polii x Ovis aries]|uniref:Choline transporter-like protein n=2 Tax=Ovis TaxID=9935 RepID=A0AAD4UQK3_OVIAM|nr:hypothetical protein MG293_001749 [Ovis ammon polii]KAI4580019.1 hypothetical protein MJT46_001387 [Ovis ammon polii x Ovis aries]KAI4590841.1 hypothetical protein MJG53_001890 [Ovis ammon polii x Ovis aries]